MRKIMCNKTKQGAASFYVVAFSTLVLLIVVASFTALVIAQITRSSNDDLSQSAYDSALAGVEDAKLAYYSYQNCLAQGASGKEVVNDTGTPLSCGDIITLVEKSSDDCDVVARILGRTIAMDSDGNKTGVLIDEVKGKSSTDTKGANNMQQAYTCVKVNSSLPDYRTTLSPSNAFKAIDVKIDKMGREDMNLDMIKKIKVSWGSELSSKDVKMTNFEGGQVKFKQVSSSEPAANPPTIGIAVVQAESEYTAEDLRTVKDGRTDNGMVYLTPVTLAAESVAEKAYSHYGTAFGWDEGAKMNVSKISASALVNSNNRQSYKMPYGVSCPYTGTSDDVGEFACAAMIELPEPVDSNGDGTGVRSDDNFIVAMFLPYGAPTDIMLEFFCADGVDICGTQTIITDEGKTEEKSSQVNLKGVQVEVDSTGKANDLFRRVATRLEASGSSAMSVMGPLELFGLKDDGDSENVGLEKDYSVQCEWSFEPKACPPLGSGE